MYTIVHKRALNPSVTWMDIEAPFIARKAKAGQFVILRVNETGERIPLTKMCIRDRRPRAASRSSGIGIKSRCG